MRAAYNSCPLLHLPLVRSPTSLHEEHTAGDREDNKKLFSFCGFIYLFLTFPFLFQTCMGRGESCLLLSASFGPSSLKRRRKQTRVNKNEQHPPATSLPSSLLHCLFWSSLLTNWKMEAIWSSLVTDWEMGGRINRTGMETTQDKNQRELTLFIPLLSDSSFLIPVPLLLAFFLKRTGQRFRSLGIRVQGLGFESRDEQESGKGRTRDGQDSSLLLFDFTLFRYSLWPLCCCCSQEAYVGMYTNSPELRL